MRARTAEQGYVLMFVLAVLVLVSVLVLGVASTLRLDAALARHQRDGTLAEFAARGALDFTAAQLLLTEAIERAQPPIPGTQPPAPDPRRWRLGGGPYQIDVGELPVRVWLADAALRPDANLLLPDEWERLLRLVFNYEKPQAEAAARRITQARTQLSAQRGLKGFGSMHELMVTAGLDRDTVYGTGGDSPALAQLLSLGTGQKRLEANLAPLPLVQAMADAPAAAVRRLADLRAEYAKATPPKRLTAEEAASIVGRAPDMFFVGPSEQIDVRLAVQPPGQSGPPWRYQALLRKGPGGYAVESRGADATLTQPRS